MSNNSSAPVKVPPSASSYSAATLDPELRSQINTVLLKEGHVQRIQEQLLHSLHANKSNWPTDVQAHALSLLRSGDVTTFPALLKRVLEDVRQDTLTKPPSGTEGTKSNGAKTNGSGGGNGNSAAAAAAASSPSPSQSTTTAGEDKPSLALPTAVVEEMLKIVRESLETVVDIDEGDRG